jgi:hypothetical protein
MLITFNTSGSLANIDFQNDSFSQGDSNIHIIDVIIDDESFNNLDYNGYVQFIREGETTPSPKMIMTHTAKGYTFKMKTDWYTAIAGTLKMTIEIKQYDENGLQSNKAYGVINIPVMESVSGISDVETTITDEEYLALVNSLNKKANINTTNTFSERQYFKENVYISKDICSEGNDHFVAGANSEGGYVFVESADADKKVSIKPNRIELECENEKKSISLNPGEDAIEISDLYISNRLSVEERATFNGETRFNEETTFNDNVIVGDTNIKSNDIYMGDQLAIRRFTDGRGGNFYVEDGSANKSTDIEPAKITFTEKENKTGFIRYNADEDAIEISDLYTPNRLSVGNNTYIKDQEIITPNIDIYGTATIHNINIGDKIFIDSEEGFNTGGIRLNSDGLHFEDAITNSYITEIDSTKVYTPKIVFNEGIANLISHEIDESTKKIIEFEDGNTYLFGDRSFDTIINSATKPRWRDGSGNYKELATTEDVDEKVADLVNSAPEALNTLGELATALQNHEDAYDSLLEVVGKKADATPNPEFDSVKTSTINIDDKVFIDVEEGFSMDGTRLDGDKLYLEGRYADSGYTKITHEEIEHNGLTYQYPQKSGALLTSDDIGSTAIPEEVGKYVGSVYFNTSLSKEEVANIIKQAIPNMTSSEDYCILDTETDSGVKILIGKSGPSTNVYSIYANIHIKNNEYMQAVYFTSNNGWSNIVSNNPNINNQSIKVDEQIVNVDNSYTRNNAGLKSLISTIPFDGGLVAKTLEIEEKLNSGAGGSLPTNPEFDSVKVNKPEWEDAIIIQDPNDEEVQTRLQSTGLYIKYHENNINFDPELLSMELTSPMGSTYYEQYGINMHPNEGESRTLIFPQKDGTLATTDENGDLVFDDWDKGIKFNAVGSKIYENSEDDTLTIETAYRPRWKNGEEFKELATMDDFTNGTLQNVNTQNERLNVSIGTADGGLYVYDNVEDIETIYKSGHIINNGEIINLPNKSGTLATLDDISSGGLPSNPEFGTVIVKSQEDESQVTTILSSYINVKYGDYGSSLTHNGLDMWNKSGETINETFYKNNHISYNGNKLIFPNKTGTLATLDDIQGGSGGSGGSSDSLTANTFEYVEINKDDLEFDEDFWAYNLSLTKDSKVTLNGFGSEDSIRVYLNGYKFYLHSIGDIENIGAITFISDDEFESQTLCLNRLDLTIDGLSSSYIMLIELKEKSLVYFKNNCWYLEKAIIDMF